MTRRALILTAVALSMWSPFANPVAAQTEGQHTSDPRVADIIEVGKLRVALGLGSPVLAMKNPTTGEVQGPALDLGRELAAKIGVSLQPVEYPRLGAVYEGLRQNEWDVTFLAEDPDRAADADFSPPYLQSDFTYLVPAGSSRDSVTEMDETGVRIAVGRGDASDLLLRKILKHAELVRADTLAAAVDMLRTGRADAFAAPRAVLLALGKQLPDSHVLHDGFASMVWVAMVPKGKTGHLSYVSEFIEDAKTLGLIKQLIERYSLQGIQVAPAGKASMR